MTTQLTLGIGIRDDATFDNFFVGDNANVIASLREFVAGGDEIYLYLSGGEGVGRSHLLQACCNAMSASSQSVVYLPLRDNVTLQPQVLEGLENLSLICIDDINVVLNIPEWEEALFHCYNRARETKTKLIIAGNAPAAQLKCQLPDLQSRLTWGLSFDIKGLNEEQMLLALQMRAHYRGIQLSREVAQFLLKRFPRNMSSLFELLEKLDKASMQAKRRITIPFAREVLI